ncbi:hypothetical protein GPECTOR_35g945 [Gonium pectorale]|uniref:FAD-binding domain-containing protein n=1 Tax=Gonium pectorale TaxID=33097 RepID=A0A150GCC8_GONPE|nr:hypothetical protein GPECTOR_35g945 [Gonium pectorale]|eukprot:KXZ47507.1 hypothetical protein GPECTOR_35g945 [Gonium pectorale]
MPGARVKVFEAAAGYRPQGAGVQIEINGWRALHAVDAQLADRIRSQGILISGSIYMDESGARLPFQEPAVDHEGNIQAYGHTAVMVHWGDIRQSLFEALPEGTVSFSTRVVGLTPGQPGRQPAVLQLQETGGDGSGGGAARTVTAGLVIATDGYYSRTKRMVFGASGPPLLPTFRGKLIWRALVAYPDPASMPALLRQAGQAAQALWWMASGMPPERTALVYPVNDNRFVWTCAAPVGDIEAAGLPAWVPHRGDQDLGIQQTGAVGTDPQSRCLAVFRRHPPELRDLLARTDPRVITEHGYYTHDMQLVQGAPDWLRGNVVILGDAAHTGPPDGMGLNMAWEDVATLAACLQDHGVTQEALTAYCDLRLPRVHAMWGENDLVKPRRVAAKRAAAFRPLGPASSGPERTGPPPSQQHAQAQGQQGSAPAAAAAAAEKGH